MRIAIQGAGIAGPALAWWLRKCRHEVLLVERAPALRSGGYIIDFWGVGYDIAQKMGLLPQIREQGYPVKEVRFVDQDGCKCGGFPVDVFARMTGGRYTSLRRSDVAATIYRALDGGVERIFGDSIAGIEERNGCARVSFDHAAARDVDLVIGADGLHSRVRGLKFGPEDKFETFLGYYVGAFEIQGYRPRDELVYVSHANPGRQISRFSMRDDKTLFLFVFREEYLPKSYYRGSASAKDLLTGAFSDMGWECPRILAAMSAVEEIYFDRVSQIRMPRWTDGRVALIGDAAACVSFLAGEGTGLAMAEAYALAGELRRHGNDYVAAFASYEQRMMPFLRQKQDAAAKFASAFIPKSILGLSFRNIVISLLDFRWIADSVVGHMVRDDVALPDYEF
ncbi:MAG TPA: FAD-binding domain [Chthoniobacter sp.]|jgi:2-polyprenyl-6-methoxyphenol hydroxylase-like FAD-dependent oxidoreductase